MTLGAVAEIRVKDPSVLAQPVLHRIPTCAMKERFRIELGVGVKRTS
ncbi:MAG: hypothetical protein HY553_02235 [Elusimicrobia bacterium]|nr:hypothetical protein [Elusimicrobiota bacterium]